MKTLTLDGAYVDARLVGSTVADRRRLAVPIELPFEQPADGTTRRARRGDAAQPGGRRLVARLGLAADYQRSAAQPRAPLVQCRDVRRPAALLGARDADRARRSTCEGPRRRSTRRRVMTDGADRLRVAGEPLRRDRALGGPAAARRRRPRRRATASAPRSTRSTSPTREDDVPRQRQRARLPAQPVVAVGVPGRPARRQHRHAGVVGRGRRQPVVPDDAPRERRRARPGRPASAGSARASASTPCASSATPATSSRSGRSTRSTRSTSPTRRSRACSAS